MSQENDGIYAMVPREVMCESARKLRDTYARVPGISLFKREFGYYCVERWKEQGTPQDVPLAELFSLRPAGQPSPWTVGLERGRV